MTKKNESLSVRLHYELFESASDEELETFVRSNAALFFDIAKELGAAAN